MAHLNVGREAWQLPIPMLKTAEGWHFDMAQAADEIQTRTLANELSAIQAMHAYVDAQNEFKIQRYAEAVHAPGKSGLYWPTARRAEPVGASL
jgi:hypothetical protein